MSIDGRATTDASSTTTHPAQAAAETLVRNVEAVSVSASPRTSPSVNGSASQSRRSGHGPSFNMIRTRSRFAPPSAG